MGQPPVLDITFNKLARRGTQQMLSGGLGLGKAERHSILQLIAKTIGPPGLIKRRASPDSASECLIQQPAIEHDIHGSVRGLDLDGPKQCLPLAGHLVLHNIEILTIAGDKGTGLLSRAPFAEQDDKLQALTRRKQDLGLQGGAGIHSRTRSAR
ncbi:hypothetical protein D3C78_1435280 [compost metagenome]